MPRDRSRIRGIDGCALNCQVGGVFIDWEKDDEGEEKKIAK